MLTPHQNKVELARKLTGVMGLCVILSVFLGISFANPSTGWCLKSLEIQECDFELLHVSLYNFRAFISIVSRSENPVATLVETSWPENVLSFVARPFPHAHNSDCQGIVQSWRTAVDTHGRLWVVDRGSAGMCAPKIVVYNLKTPWYSEVHRHVFVNASEGIFTSLTIDPVPHGHFTRAYLTVGESNCIVVYSLEEKKFWTLCTKSMQIPPKFSESLILPTGLLYLYDSTHNVLHTADLSILRKRNFTENEAILMDTNPIGNFMGSGKFLHLDTNSAALYFIIPRFGAVVKWNTEKPLVAENQQILHIQSPDMVGLLFSFQNSIWIVNAIANGDKHTHRIK